jgi:hypothetical protein
MGISSTQGIDGPSSVAARTISDLLPSLIQVLFLQVLLLQV